MNRRVFDASAVLAAIFLEPGADMVDELWSEGDNWISAINYAEVVTKLNERGVSDEDMAGILEGVPLTIIAFEQAAALATGLLRKSTKIYGLSLGDRACLTTGRQLGAEIVTAEHLWAKLNDYTIRLIR
jgi:ribonuclease VapC